MITFNDLVKFEDQDVTSELTTQLEEFMTVRNSLGDTKVSRGDTVLYTFIEDSEELDNLTPVFNITQVVFQNDPYGVYCVSTGSLKSIQQSY